MTIITALPSSISNEPDLPSSMGVYADHGICFLCVNSLQLQLFVPTFKNIQFVSNQSKELGLPVSPCTLSLLHRCQQRLPSPRLSFPLDCQLLSTVKKHRTSASTFVLVSMTQHPAVVKVRAVWCQVASVQRKMSGNKYIVVSVMLDAFMLFWLFLSQPCSDDGWRQFIVLNVFFELLKSVTNTMSLHEALNVCTRSLTIGPCRLLQAFSPPLLAQPSTTSAPLERHSRRKPASREIAY